LSINLVVVPFPDTVNADDILLEIEDDPVFSLIDAFVTGVPRYMACVMRVGVHQEPKDSLGNLLVLLVGQILEE
jgi:hypothetical protein